MVTKFEVITAELTDQEMSLIPLLIAGLKKRSKKNPIKAPEIVAKMNEFGKKNPGEALPAMTQPRLRKCINFIRSNALLPVIATSAGYYTSSDPDEIKDQIESLEQRAASIKTCAAGLRTFLM